MSVPAVAFQAAYARAFRAFLDDESEEARHAAYELGRDAVARELALLDLALAHHEVLVAELGRSSSPKGLRRTTRLGADFLLEALSAYEMARRALADALELVARERQQAAMLRQLSTLLADVSLAAQARSSRDEVLQLVAEQARELTGADRCVAHAEGGFGDATTTVASDSGSSALDAALAREAFAAFRAQPGASDVVSVPTSSSAGEVVAAPLTALDGRAIGALVLAAEPDRRFSELSKAVLVHIGQMTAAALERAARYRGAGERRH